MQKMTPICNFMREVSYVDKDGNSRSFMRKKFPKLSEAYEHFFEYAPPETSLHDALVDVILCLRIYLQINDYNDICGESPVLLKYLQEPEREKQVVEKDKEEIVLRRSLRIAQKNALQQQYVI